MSQNFGTLDTYLLHAYNCSRCTELFLVVNHNTKFPGKSPLTLLGTGSSPGKMPCKVQTGSYMLMTVYSCIKL